MNEYLGNHIEMNTSGTTIFLRSLVIGDVILWDKNSVDFLALFPSTTNGASRLPINAIHSIMQ